MNYRNKPYFLNPSERKQLSAWLNAMTLEEKVGQLFCVLGEFYSSEKLNALVKEMGIGGVLFRPAPKQEILSKFTALDSLSKIPLFKAANLEDGASGALSDGTRYSSEMGVAATGDPSFARQLALSASYEAKMAGINLTFSPDCDLDLNCFNPITNERTYGSDPGLVKSFVVAEIEGLHDNGIPCCVKHFPGDGVDFRDQHLLPTYNSLAYSTWMEHYGRVYRAAIKHGVPCFMVGHIACPALSQHVNPSLAFKDCLPASLSPELLQGILRQELGFNGLILSDATIMGGFTQAYPREEALPRMIASGIDMLVFNADIDEDYGYLLNAVKKGTLPLARLNEAVSNILATKLVAIRERGIRTTNAKSGSRKDLADHSITLVKDGGKILPLSHEKYEVIRLISLGNDTYPGGSIVTRVKARLEKEGYEVELFDITKEEMVGPASLRKKMLTLYLANLETASNQTTVRINWAKKHALDSPRYIHETPYAFVSFANPFHLLDVPRVSVYINAYCANDDVIDALIDKLLGKSRFKGVSPVDPFCQLEDTHL
jgi:beta-N-acetylhexosaminidase